MSQQSAKFIDTIMSAVNLNRQSSVDDKDSIKSEFAGETLEKLFANEEMADFYFTFDSGERVPVQKSLLSAGSDVFRTLFNGSWKGKSEEKLTSITVAAFKEFLQFFYFNKVKLTMENIADVMRLSKTYNVAICSTVSGQFLKSQLNDNNVLWAHELAIRYDEKELKKLCEKIIGYNVKVIFASENFKTCSREVLSNLLDMEEMMCCSEADVFEACMDWVKHASKQEHLTKDLVKEKLGDLFYKIRYGAMPLKDISRLLVSYKHLFDTDEYKTIMEMCTPGESHSLLFCEPRQKSSKTVPWKAEDLIYCIGYGRFGSRKNKSPYTVKDVEGTTFSSDKPLMLTAIATESLCADEKFNPLKEDVPTEVTIFEIDPSNSSETVILPKEKAVLQSKGGAIQLSKLIFIKPNVQYKIRLEQSPPKGCSLRGGYQSSKVYLRRHGSIVTFHNEIVEEVEDVYGYAEDGLAKLSRGLIVQLRFMATDPKPAQQLRRPDSGLYFDYI